MIIEGKNVVFEALSSGQTFNKLFISKQNKDAESQKIIDLAKQKNIRIDFVDKFLLDKKTLTHHHQGVIAEVVDFEYSDIDDILKRADERCEQPLIVILDGVKDPHNLGAIIRSAECAGAHGIVIPKNRSVSVNETVIKTSAGAISNMLIARVTNINYLISDLKQRGLWVYGFEAGKNTMYQTNLKGMCGRTRDCHSKKQKCFCQRNSHKNFGGRNFKHVDCARHKHKLSHFRPQTARALGLWF